MRQRPEVSAVHRLLALGLRLREEQQRSLELQAALFAAEEEVRRLSERLAAGDPAGDSPPGVAAV